MSSVPDWLNETVRSFGRQMGMEHFVLNEHGAAAIRFENGVSLKLEYGMESLIVSLRIMINPQEHVLRRLLSMAHYNMKGEAPVRCYYLSKTGEGGCSLVFPEGQVSVNVLETALSILWQRMEYIRRNS